MLMRCSRPILARAGNRHSRRSVRRWVASMVGAHPRTQVPSASISSKSAAGTRNANDNLLAPGIRILLFLAGRVRALAGRPMVGRPMVGRLRVLAGRLRSHQCHEQDGKYKCHKNQRFDHSSILGHIGLPPCPDARQISTSVGALREPMARERRTLDMGIYP
jgi:hypothetical protein